MTDTLSVVPILSAFTTAIRDALTAHAQDPLVAGFKSIVCYRTGLDVSMYSSQAGLKFSLLDVFKMLQAENKVRLAHKDLNDLVVRTTLEVAGKYQKPGKWRVFIIIRALKLFIQFNFTPGSAIMISILSSRRPLDCNRSFEAILRRFSFSYTRLTRTPAKQAILPQSIPMYILTSERYGSDDIYILLLILCAIGLPGSFKAGAKGNSQSTSRVDPVKQTFVVQYVSTTKLKL
jgi:hypothetical protein